MENSRKMKNPAPPPPGPPQATPRRLPRNIVPDGGVATGVDIKENVLRPRVELRLSLPSGVDTTSTFDGRKALMDLLVEVCGHYHLNPAYHTLELLSSEGQPVAFKPNAFLGSLDVACALIKERVVEERLVRKPAPKVPEKTIRLVVNYHRSQKTVVRVNPLAPLHTLVPIICQKCEFDPTHVLLLRDSVSRHELDLNKSLSDLEIRELYALDQSLESTYSTQSVGATEKKGLLGFFKFNRRKSKAISGVSSSLCVEARPSTLGQSQSVMNISRMSPRVELKKRRAPAPPPSMNQSYASLQVHPCSSSTSSLLRKRKAPVAPSTPDSNTSTPTPPIPDTDVSPAAPQATPRASPAPAAAAAPTAVLPPVTSVRRVARQDDSASELSGSSEELDRATLCSSSSSQADSVPSSHLDEVAVSSQDEEEEEEEEEEVEVDEDMELEAQVLQHLQQRSQQQQQQQLPHTQPVVVERMQQQPVTPRIQTLREPQASEPKQQQQPPQQPPQQPQGQKQQQPQDQQHDSDRSSTPADSCSTASLRMEETDNNRHSAVDAGRQVPVKPRRTSVGDQTSQAASASPALVDRNSHNASPDSFTDMPQHSWLHSARPAEGAEVPVDSVETGSVSSSSGSFADQGYAASEGTAEDPCPLGSPSDITPPHAQRDISSDSDEGCATWNSRTSGDLQQKGQSGKIKNSYEEDPKLMAQLQITLADLDAELAEMNQSSESPSEADDVIPVSVVDLVPVTTIDEVSDIHLSPGCDRESVSGDAQWTSITKNKNKNNSATLCPEPAVQPRVSAEQRGTRTTQEVKQSASKEKTSKPEATLRVNEIRGSASGTKPAAVVPPSAKNTSVVVPPNPQPSDGGRSRAPPKAQEVLAPRREGTKITQMPASRFGTKTFTIVPTKASMPSAPQTQATHTIGAIKIDEQGNMVKGGGARHLAGPPAEREEEEAVAGPLQAKAKFFWTSTDKPETPTTTKTTTATATAAPQKAREPEAPPKLAPAGADIKPAHNTQPETDSSSSVSVRDHSSTAKDGSHYSQSLQVSEPAGTAQRATLNPQDPRDLSFLKQQRRTSSQYMATALTTKYTVRPAVRADAIQEKPPAPAQKPSVEIRSATTTTITSSTNKGYNTSTQKAVPKENGSVSSWTALQSPLAYKSHTLTKQTTVEPPRPLQEGTGTTSRVDSGVVNSKTKLTTQVPTNRSNSTHNPSSAQPDKNGEPWASPGVLPEPNQVNIFGPVKKFKPVIQKCVEKDTSLHTSLMVAIQSGDSKERLRKAGSGLRKPTLVEDENSHSALLSAIRANSSTRLNKTRSEAARELDRFRVKESESGFQKQTSAPPHTSPPSAPPPVAAALPPPPPPPAMAPRPPRAVLVSAGNPEESRDALLEAIRSGAGAQGLKKVPVATKTVQVNGRLGTIQASCSLSQGV